MLNWLRRRRLSTEARRKLMLAAARAEEAIIETHVAQALDLVHALADELDPESAIGVYLELLELGEPLAGAVTNRTLARLHDRSDAEARPARGRFQDVFRGERGERAR